MTKVTPSIVESGPIYNINKKFPGTDQDRPTDRTTPRSSELKKSEQKETQNKFVMPKSSMELKRGQIFSFSLSFSLLPTYRTFDFFLSRTFPE